MLRHRFCIGCADLAGEVEAAVLCPRGEGVAAAVRRGEWEPDGSERYCGRCGGTVGPHEATASGCASCRGKVLAYEGVVRLGAYREPLAGWVGDLKFRREVGVAKVLGRCLAGAVRERLEGEAEEAWGRAEREVGMAADGGGAGTVDGGDGAGTRAEVSLASDGREVGGGAAEAVRRVDWSAVVVTPVPMSEARRLRRGIDHTGQLARAVARELGVRYVRGLATKWHPPQHLMEGGDRERNLRSAFRVRRGAAGAMAGKTVILVDDVLTTGSTARAAALALTGRDDLRFKAADGGPGGVLLGVVAVASRSGRGRGG